MNPAKYWELICLSILSGRMFVWKMTVSGYNAASLTCQRRRAGKPQLNQVIASGGIEARRDGVDTKPSGNPAWPTDRPARPGGNQPLSSSWTRPHASARRFEGGIVPPLQKSSLKKPSGEFKPGTRLSVRFGCGRPSANPFKLHPLFNSAPSGFIPTHVHAHVHAHLKPLCLKVEQFDVETPPTSVVLQQGGCRLSPA